MNQEKKLSIPEIVICPTCGLNSNFVPPPKEEEKKLVVTFICPNGHSLTKVIDLL